MIEMKVRCWCEFSERMYYSYNRWWSMSQKDGYCWLYEKDNDDSNKKIRTTNLMRYTGEEDKNGKEIYEGDICRNDEGEFGKVVFDDGAFFLALFDTFDPMCLCNHLSLIEEVIGNIYENPELLKGGE